jgi:SAM-dependent methyltransferase
MDSKKVEGIFDSISARYDVANTFISLGIEKYWRRKFSTFINGKEKRILDACCGTGVSTFDIWKKNGFYADIIGIDFSAEMLDVARKRFSKKVPAERKSPGTKYQDGTLQNNEDSKRIGRYSFIEKDITDTGFKDNFLTLLQFFSASGMLLTGKMRFPSLCA